MIFWYNNVITLLLKGYYGAYGVTVNTRVCGTLNLGSIPSRHPKKAFKPFMVF